MENRKAMHAPEKINITFTYTYMKNYAIYHFLFILLYFGIPVSVFSTIRINSNIYIQVSSRHVASRGGHFFIIWRKEHPHNLSLSTGNTFYFLSRKNR